MNTELVGGIEGLRGDERLPAGVVKKLVPFAAVLKEVSEYASVDKPDVALLNIIRVSGINEQYAGGDEENMARLRNIN